MRRALIAAVALAVPLLSCGGGQPARAPTSIVPAPGATAEQANPTPVGLPGDTAAHGSVSASSNEVHIDAHDDYFTPTYIKVSPGSTVHVTVKNHGDPHTFTLFGTDAELVLAQGGQETLTVQVPPAGIAFFYCRYHVSTGMQGAIYSREGARIEGPSLEDRTAEGR